MKSLITILLILFATIAKSQDSTKSPVYMGPVETDAIVSFRMDDSMHGKHLNETRLKNGSSVLKRNPKMDSIALERCIRMVDLITKRRGKIEYRKTNGIGVYEYSDVAMEVFTTLGHGDMPEGITECGSFDDRYDIKAESVDSSIDPLKQWNESKEYLDNFLCDGVSWNGSGEHFKIRTSAVRNIGNISFRKDYKSYGYAAIHFAVYYVYLDSSGNTIRTTKSLETISYEVFELDPSKQEIIKGGL